MTVADEPPSSTFVVAMKAVTVGLTYALYLCYVCTSVHIFIAYIQIFIFRRDNFIKYVQISQIEYKIRQDIFKFKENE